MALPSHGEVEVESTYALEVVVGLVRSKLLSQVDPQHYTLNPVYPKRSILSPKP